jgi:hypothetical protein
VINFHFEKLRLDGAALDSDWDVLLRLVAEFAILVPPAFIPLYKEEEFCVVEFAMQITQWLARVRRDPVDFSYTSLESEETGLVSITRRQHGWTISALHEDYREDRHFRLGEIETSVAEFVARLKAAVQQSFQRDISHLVSGKPIAL